jgi:hypothetical protein
MRRFSLLPSLLSGLFLCTPAAWAQYQSGHWLHADYTYSDLDFAHTGTVSEKARLAGVRGELGLNLGGLFALSAGGQYQDGHMNFDGDTLDGGHVTALSSGYIRDLRAMLHVVRVPFVLSAGVGDRLWTDHPSGSYRRDAHYAYYPVKLTLFMNRIYVSVEDDIWRSGSDRVHMSDADPTRADVELTPDGGQGVGAEIGLFIPGALFRTHLYLSYHRWSVKASDTRNDGVADLQESSSTTSVLQGGIGVAF